MYRERYFVAENFFFVFAFLIVPKRSQHGSEELGLEVNECAANEYSRGAVQGFQFHAYLSKEENEYIEVFVHRPGRNSILYKIAKSHTYM